MAFAPANQSDRLKAVIPNEYRVVASLAKAALAILLGIIDDDSETHVESLHTILDELKEWQQKSTGALICKTCFVNDPNRFQMTSSLRQDHDDFVVRLNAINLKAALHKREYQGRMQGNPRAVDIPADYDAKETLIQIMNLLNDFQNMFDI